MEALICASIHHCTRSTQIRSCHLTAVGDVLCECMKAQLVPPGRSGVSSLLCLQRPCGFWVNLRGEASLHPTDPPPPTTALPVHSCLCCGSALSTSHEPPRAPRTAPARLSDAVFRSPFPLSWGESSVSALQRLRFQ